MIIYGFDTGAGDWEYYRTKREAIREAKAFLKDDDDGEPIEVERHVVDRPTKGLVVNILNGNGWCKARDVVYVAH
jgi:hypothetical protein